MSTGPRLSRRDFLGGGIALAAAGIPLSALRSRAAEVPAARPNVLWISAEDLSPDLGCYGDAYAVTPRLDEFARESVRYDRAFATMGVCAPARSGIITGVYPTRLGTNHMRCSGVPPENVRCFSEYLRAAGYYCTNRSKTDYQFESPGTAWDAGKEDWRGRADGQPFFCVINIGTTHEGQIRSDRAERSLPAGERHDPAKAPVPPYHPDTPVVRRDWANYYDLGTIMDREVGSILDRLDADGLAGDTVVWFWGDHGRGLPRGKRWIYDSGLRFPLLIRIPARLRESIPAPAPGAAEERLVSFVDFASTMLSLAGVEIPEAMDGRAFLGPRAAPPREYIFAARDRVDEAVDMIRAVRDRRFKYIRNFMAHLPRSLDVDYMNRMPTMQEMRRLHAAGLLTGAQRQYFECPKPVEELYDTETDPHEVRNLAGDPGHAETLARLRAALFDHMLETGDFGLIPEPEFDAMKRPGDVLEATSAPGFSVRNTPAGRRVRIACDTPGASISYTVREATRAADGVRLDWGAAEVHGAGLQKTPTGIQGWRDTRTWLSWEADLPQAGNLPVYVLSAKNGRGGSPFTIRIGDTELSGTVQETGGWDNHRYFKVGEVEIPAPGKVAVWLKPVPRDGIFSMNFKEIRIGGSVPDAGGAGPPAARLYTEPVLLEAGRVLSARAYRLGFRPSPEVTYRAGDGDQPPAPSVARPHWRVEATRRDIASRCLRLKMLDGTGKPGMDACLAALADPEPCVRYWAVTGAATGSYGSTDPLPAEECVRLLAPLLRDGSASVRIVAARYLLATESGAEAAAVLRRELAGELASGRTYAATAILHAGEAGRSLLADVRAAAASGGYVSRLCGHILNGLEAP